MNKSTPFRYASLVWLTGLLGIPLTGALASSIVDILERESFGNSISYESWEWFGMMAISQGMLLFPSWLLFIWMVNIVCKRDGWGWNKKWVLFAGGSILVFLNAIIWQYFIFFFWVPFSCSILIYRLPVQNQDES